MRAAAFVAVLLVGCGPAALPHGAPAESCGGCHAAEYAAWRTTPHAHSTASPVFQALLPRVEAAWGRSARARCEACHAPGFGGDEGIGCVTCHGAVGNRGAANGALVVSLDAPLAGPKALSNAAHDVEPRGLLRSSELCGTCHEVHGPGLLEEPTLTEFSRTRFASADDCVTCHTSSLSPWGEGRGEGNHALTGVDPDWATTDDGGAARALWRRALTLDAQWREATLVVTLTNSGGGHDVPTGAAQLREVWTTVQFLDAGGTPLHTARVLDLGAKLERDGREVPLLTDATSVTPRGLAAGEARTASLPRPPGAVRAVVRVEARALREEALHELGLDTRAAQVPALLVAEVAVD